MEFEVYCDESRPELFTSQAVDKNQFLMIGSLWLPQELRRDIKTRIKMLREKHHAWGKIKWRKISPSKQDFYVDLVDLFMNYGLDLRFRCSAIAADKVHRHWHNGDNGLGFYKFYYQMLHHWILDFNQYAIFCDTQTHRKLKHLAGLHQCLSQANLKHLAGLHQCLTQANLISNIKQVQALPSREMVLIQLTDFLLGMAGARLNNSIQKGGAKDNIIQRLEGHLHIAQLKPTGLSEKKFNIFQVTDAIPS
jgi:hypothetical protein